MKALRQQRGMSQEALAAACNLHRTYIGLIERGERSLSIPTIETIAAALRIKPEELFVNVENGAPPTAPKRAAKTPTLGQLAAELAAIRQILIRAKLIDAKGYGELLKRSEEG